MKSMIAVFALVSLSSSAFAAPNLYVRNCSPETGNGREEIKVALDLKNRKATLWLNGQPIPQCTNVLFKGHLVDYGKRSLTIQCKEGKAIFRQNYDEETIEIKGLKLPLSTDVYMC